MEKRIVSVDERLRKLEEVMGVSRFDTLEPPPNLVDEIQAVFRRKEIDLFARLKGALRRQRTVQVRVTGRNVLWNETYGTL